MRVNWNFVICSTVIPNEANTDVIDHVDKQNGQAAQQNGKPKAKMHGKQGKS